jgi:hypothetical protein
LGLRLRFEGRRMHESTPGPTKAQALENPECSDGPALAKQALRPMLAETVGSATSISSGVEPANAGTWKVVPYWCLSGLIAQLRGSPSARLFRTCARSISLRK